MIGIILSIIFPGLGQIYFKKHGKGILMIILAIIPFFYPFVLIWSIIDAIRLNKSISSGNRYSTKETIIGIIIFFLIVPFTIYLLFIGSGIIFDKLLTEYLHPKNTKNELLEIKIALDKYKRHYQKYPEDYFDFTDQKLIRKPWEVDAWNRKYKYVLHDSLNFELVSAGLDGKFDTSDDIRIVND